MSEPVNKPVPSENGAAYGRKKTRLLIIAGVVALLLIFYGVRWWLDARGHAETDDATISGHLHPVSPRVNGTVTAVLVKENQLVKAGDLLVMLDPRDYQIALQQAQAQLVQARTQAQAAQAGVPWSRGQYVGGLQQARGTLGAAQAAVGQAVGSLKEAQAGVANAREQLSQQEANLEKARKDYQRYMAVDPRAVSAQQRDAAKAAYEAAMAARDAAAAIVSQALARVSQAQSNVAASQAKVLQSRGSVTSAMAENSQIAIHQQQVGQAQASIQQAEAAVRQAQLNLAYTRITAPSDGKVGRKTVEVGQRVQPGQALMSVVEPNLWVTANFKETQLERIKPGQPVEIDVDAYPHHRFEGRVESLSPASGAQFALLPPENATGNFTKIVQRVPVKILFDNRSVRGYENRLVPGMSVVVKVAL